MGVVPPGDRLEGLKRPADGSGRASATALLTVILSLGLCAGAWAQGGEEPVSPDDPVSSDDPPARGPGPSQPEDGAEATGSRGGAGNCDPNYEGVCLDPNASDYDCEGGGGDGPRFVRGPIRVVGDDPFELDTPHPDKKPEQGFSRRERPDSNRRPPVK